MLGKPKGYIGIKHEITHSRTPGPGPFPDINLTEDYFNALQGKTVPVIDIAVDGSSYLVFGKGEKSGGFIWDIDKEDTTQQLIPYKFFHPGVDVDDIISFLKIIQEGGSTPCANFMNQEAIDTILQKKNEDMMEQDRQTGVKEPKPLYSLGRNVCIECRGETLMGGHRACFTAREVKTR
ncbi:hypothetical protein LCGC14_0541390 [marine sediment metagenome]|uniref:Uncharacterized protein n=1 Tax=marine sediment metagenome TaxID=412755 RepID=A0A0F9RST9_9ZZZZ